MILTWKTWARPFKIKIQYFFAHIPTQENKAQSAIHFQLTGPQNIHLKHLKLGD
jgi:hypothetical protein